MKRFSNRLATALALIFLVGLPAAAKTEITVSVAFGEGTHEFAVMQSVTDLFNESQKEIHANLLSVPTPNTIEDKLVTLFLSGQAPDVVMIADLSLAAYAHAGILAPIDAYIARSGVDESDYWPPVWEAGQYDGHHYAMPMHTGVRLLFGNTELMRQNGIAEMPATIEELDELTRKITRRASSDTYEQIGFIPWWGQGYVFHTWAWAFGGSFYDEATHTITVDHPKNVGALEWMGAYGRSYPELRGGVGNHFTGARDLVFLADGSWQIGLWRDNVPDFEFEVSLLPVPEGEKPSTWSGSWMFALPAGTSAPDAAWEFIKFATGVPGQVAYARQVFMPPVNIEAMRILVDELEKKYGPGVRVAYESMAYTVFRPKIPVGPQLWAETQTVWAPVINEGVEPKGLLENIDRTLQAELNEVLAR